ncbi:MAG: hypothetical protein SPH81_10670 [Intestinibacter sp.]|nr:hypothetical protein [Intestinibacter sp.]MDY5213004.1 hypothetical protein [Intestinibacter sp.]
MQRLFSMVTQISQTIINKFKFIIGINLNKITKMIIISAKLSNLEPNSLVAFILRAIKPSRISVIPQNIYTNKKYNFIGYKKIKNNDNIILANDKRLGMYLIKSKPFLKK